MKVVAFNGSPKENGNTYEAIKAVVSELEKDNIEENQREDKIFMNFIR